MYPFLSPVDFALPNHYTGDSDTIDLTNCEREPIHIPGSIQPQGFFLFWKPDSDRILAASKNCLELFGTEQILDSSLKERIAPESSGLWYSELEQARQGIPSPFPLTLRRLDGTFLRGQGVIQSSQGGMILEWERANTGKQNVTTPDPIYYSNRLKRKDTYQEIVQEIAQIIRDATGFNRVMVYRFDRNWNGQVISEAKEPNLESFLDLHYPASDIPAQARKLYLQNTVRLIQNINYVPVPLITSPEINEPLDLSLSKFRSVSPIHIQYLRNMGVNATLTISLILNQRLWGLVACHHYAPKQINLPSLRVCEWFSEFFSLSLKAVLDKQESDYKLYLSRNHDSILSKIADLGPDWKEILKTSEGPNKLLHCDGALVCFGGEVYTSGEAPDTQSSKKLIQWLQLNCVGMQYFSTETLLSLGIVPELKDGKLAGMLAVPMDSEFQNWTIWFRLEYLHTIRWAGDPVEKVLTKAQDGVLALSPRNSFAEFKQLVRGFSLPWLPEEIEAAIQYRTSVNALLFNQLARIGSLRTEIESLKIRENRSRQELLEKEVMIKEIHHRVKNNLQVINSILYLQSSYAKNPETTMALEESQNRIRSMALVHEMLYQSDTLSRISVSCYFDQLIHNILQTFENRSKPSELKIQLDDLYLDLDTGIPVGLILNELFTNALKYSLSEDSKKVIEICLRKKGEEELFLEVRDRGTGLPTSVDWERPKTLGLTLVQSLVRQLRGEIHFQNQNGLCVQLTVPWRAQTR